MKKLSILLLFFLFSCQEKGSSSIPIGSIHAKNDAIQVKIPTNNNSIKFIRSNYIEECNSSGLLIYSYTSENKIYSSSFICDGKNGESGKNGENGLDGLISLINFERKKYIHECGTSGLLIINGLDKNKNNILNNDEIQNITYLCDGQDQPELNIEIEEIIYPCGFKVKEENEILLKLNNNDIISYFENGSKRYLTILEENKWYQTSDKKQCKFKIINGEIIY